MAQPAVVDNNSTPHLSDTGKLRNLHLLLNELQIPVIVLEDDKLPAEWPFLVIVGMNKTREMASRAAALIQKLIAPTVLILSLSPMI